MREEKSCSQISVLPVLASDTAAGGWDGVVDVHACMNSQLEGLGISLQVLLCIFFLLFVFPCSVKIYFLPLSGKGGGLDFIHTCAYFPLRFCVENVLRNRSFIPEAAR